MKNARKAHCGDQTKCNRRRGINRPLRTRVAYPLRKQDHHGADPAGCQSGKNSVSPSSANGAHRSPGQGGGKAESIVPGLLREFLLQDQVSRQERQQQINRKTDRRADHPSQPFGSCLPFSFQKNHSPRNKNVTSYFRGECFIPIREMISRPFYSCRRGRRTCVRPLPSSPAAQHDRSWKWPTS